MAHVLHVDAKTLGQLRLSPSSGVTQLGDPPTDVTKQALVLAH